MEENAGGDMSPSASPPKVRSSKAALTSRIETRWMKQRKEYIRKHNLHRLLGDMMDACLCKPDSQLPDNPTLFLAESILRTFLQSYQREEVRKSVLESTSSLKALRGLHKTLTDIIANTPPLQEELEEEKGRRPTEFLKVKDAEAESGSTGAGEVSSSREHDSPPPPQTQKDTFLRSSPRSSQGRQDILLHEGETRDGVDASDAIPDPSPPSTQCATRGEERAVKEEAGKGGKNEGTVSKDGTAVGGGQGAGVERGREFKEEASVEGAGDEEEIDEPQPEEEQSSAEKREREEHQNIEQGRIFEQGGNEKDRSEEPQEGGRDVITEEREEENGPLREAEACHPKSIVAKEAQETSSSIQGHPNPLKENAEGECSSITRRRESVVCDWEEFKAPDGKCFWYNRKHKEKTWVKPTEVAEREKKSTAADWCEIHAENSQRWYFNTRTGMKQWHRPACLVGATATKRRSTAPFAARAPPQHTFSGQGGPDEENRNGSKEHSKKPYESRTLSSEWTIFIPEQGPSYYISSVTKTKQWRKPDEFTDPILRNSGWEEYDYQGVPYFVHVPSNERTWNKGRVLQLIKERSANASSPKSERAKKTNPSSKRDLGGGWVQYSTTSSETFYVNKSTNEKTWTNPFAQREVQQAGS